MKQKAFCLAVPAKDLDLLFEALDPEGVWISHISGISNEAEATAALNKIAKWTKKQ